MDGDRRHHRVEVVTDRLDPALVAQVAAGVRHAVAVAGQALGRVGEHGLGEVVEHHRRVGHAVEHRGGEDAVPADVEGAHGRAVHRDASRHLGELSRSASRHVAGDPVVDVLPGVPVVVAEGSDGLLNRSPDPPSTLMLAPVM